MTKDNHNRKHLNLSQRILIEKGLSNNDSFSEIARKAGKDSSTISKEVRRHRSWYEQRDKKQRIPCAKRQDCRMRSLCGRKDCIKLCRACYDPKIHCSDICPDYTEKTCEKLIKAPYVCNGCPKKSNCLLKRAFYAAQYADDTYRDLLVSSREGINQAPVDIAMLDGLISPLLKKGQSLAHIYANHSSEIPCSRRTLYNYIDQSVFTARNLDMRRRVRYKIRKKATRVSLLVREFRIRRTYDDFLQLMKECPDTPVVEMDTVEGSRGDGHKTLLTLFFRNCSLMLIFLLREKTQDQVTKVFDYLTDALGIEIFRSLFPVILTDNGTEFQSPDRLEKTTQGEVRTNIYYCNPHSSWQKGMIEKNHQYIRFVIPKGQSLQMYTQKDITLLMNHINSEARDSLNGCTPFKLSLILLSNKLHQELNLVEIPPDDVLLRPELLK